MEAAESQSRGESAGAERRWSWVPMLVLALMLEAVLVVLGRAPQTPWAGLGVWLAAATLVYLIAVARVLRRRPAARASSKAEMRVILLAAVAFRLTLLPMAPGALPGSGGHLLRYHWDGKVQAAGFNPYQYAPGNGLFNPIREASDGAVPNPGAAAYQAPMAERLFLWAYTLGGNAWGMKLVFTFLDLLLVWVLAVMLRARGWPAARVLIYAWSPLAVIAVAGQGHFEPAAALLAVLALAWAVRWPRLAGLMMVTAALTQFYAAALLPVVLARTRRVWRSLAGLTAAWVALLGFRYVWMDQHIAIGTTLASLRAHVAATPAYNAGLFALAQSWFGVHGAWLLAEAVILAAIVMAMGARPAAWLGDESGRVELRAGFLIVGAVLLVLPQVYPWYVLWLLPLLVFWPELPWLYFSVAVLAAVAWPGRGWVVWLEYAPLYGLLGWQVWQGRRKPASDEGAAAA